MEHEPVTLGRHGDRRQAVPGVHGDGRGNPRERRASGRDARLDRDGGSGRNPEVARRDADADGGWIHPHVGHLQRALQHRRRKHQRQDRRRDGAGRAPGRQAPRSGIHRGREVALGETTGGGGHHERRETVRSRPLLHFHRRDDRVVHSGKALLDEARDLPVVRLAAQRPREYARSRQDDRGRGGRQAECATVRQGHGAGHHRQQPGDDRREKQGAAARLDEGVSAPLTPDLTQLRPERRHRPIVRHVPVHDREPTNASATRVASISIKPYRQ